MNYSSCAEAAPATAMPQNKHQASVDRPFDLPAEDGVLECIADSLGPLFAGSRPDCPVARVTAMRTVSAYRPQDHADCINIARTVSFSLSALAVLRQAADHDMPPALKLRFLGRAISLNREADRSETAMHRRRRDQPEAAARIVAAETTAAPPPPVSAGRIDAAVGEAMREYLAGSTPSAGAVQMAESPDAGIPTPAPGPSPPTCAEPLRPVVTPARTLGQPAAFRHSVDAAHQRHHQTLSQSGLPQGDPRRSCPR